MRIESISVKPVQTIPSVQDKDKNWYQRSQNTQNTCDKLKNDFSKWFPFEWQIGTDTKKAVEKFIQEALVEGWSISKIQECLCKEDFLKLLYSKDPKYKEALDYICEDVVFSDNKINFLA